MLQTKLNDIKLNIHSITKYKNTLLLLKEREKDLYEASEKLKKVTEIYSKIKMRRYNELYI